MSKPRIIAIGDIHGCTDEFEELIDKLQLGAKDRIALLGDLVNREPDSARTIVKATGGVRRPFHLLQ